jgi:Phosphotransferase enzyme family
MQLTGTAQAQASEILEKDIYRLIVFDPAGTAILLECQGNEYHLPKIEIPRFTRTAQETTAFLRTLWGVSSIFLFSGVVGEVSDKSYFAVLESQEGICVHPPNMNWFTVHHALTTLVLSGQERRAVKSSYGRAISRILVDPREPFCRVGWMATLQDWTTNVLAPKNIEVKGFEQLNGCETFSLVRFATSQSPIWFKAVGEPNLREYNISLKLAQSLPSYVPTIIATKPEWHGWLMADAAGTTLSEVGDPAYWQSAAETLAKLQLDSIGMTDDLLDAGCRDLAIVKLLELVDPFLEVMADLMRQQTKFPPRILTSEELNDLGATLKNSLECLAGLHIPETLGHSDFNPGNIVVSPERCVFIDWAEGHVSHPFLTFEYFLSHLRKDYAQLVSFEDEIRASYSRVWGQIVSKEQIEEAYLLSPLVAVYTYAVSSHVWRDSERLKVPGFQGYLRSLTRRMKQEADLLQRRRVECPN